MSGNDLVDVCTGCKTVKVHKGSWAWEGGPGSWGDQCKLCCAPTITCHRDDIDEAYESAQRG